MRSPPSGEGTLLSMAAHRLRRVSPLAIMGRWPCLCMLVWLAAPMSKTRPVWPASQSTSAAWPRLAAAGGRPVLDRLALAGRARGRIGRSFWAAVFHVGAPAAVDRGRDPEHEADASREGLAGEEPPGRDRHRRAHAREPRALHRLRSQRTAAVAARLRSILRDRGVPNTLTLTLVP